MIKGVCSKYSLAVTPRIFGPWVRNKLLNINAANYNIQLVLDNLPASEFMVYVEQYEKASGKIEERRRRTMKTSLTLLPILGRHGHLHWK